MPTNPFDFDSLPPRQVQAPERPQRLASSTPSPLPSGPRGEGVNGETRHKALDDLALDPRVWAGISIGCAILSALLLVIAFERYQAIANAVEGVNNSLRDLSGLSGGQLKPQVIKTTVPASTNYCLFFAVLSGIGAYLAYFVFGKRARSITAKQTAGRNQTPASATCR